MNCKASCGKTQPLTCLHIGCNIFPFVTSFERPTFRFIHKLKFADMVTFMFTITKSSVAGPCVPGSAG